MLLCRDLGRLTVGINIVRVYAAAGLLLAAFLVIYLPDVGHGFIKDDFGWIAGSQVTSAYDVVSCSSAMVVFIGRSCPPASLLTTPCGD